MSSKVILAIVASIVISVAWASHDHKDHHHHHPTPYKFGYDVKDAHGSQYRKEEGNGHGAVKGSYGYTDKHGIHREVHYEADHKGFRAVVKTNEPGTANQDPAAVKIHSSASKDHDHHHHKHHDHHHHKHHDHHAHHHHGHAHHHHGHDHHHHG